MDAEYKDLCNILFLYSRARPDWRTLSHEIHPISHSAARRSIRKCELLMISHASASGSIRKCGFCMISHASLRHLMAIGFSLSIPINMTQDENVVLGSSEFNPERRRRAHGIRKIKASGSSTSNGWPGMLGAFLASRTPSFGHRVVVCDSLMNER